MQTTSRRRGSRLLHASAFRSLALLSHVVTTCAKTHPHVEARRRWYKRSLCTTWVAVTQSRSVVSHQRRLFLPQPYHFLRLPQESSASNCLFSPFPFPPFFPARQTNIGGPALHAHNAADLCQCPLIGPWNHIGSLAYLCPSPYPSDPWAICLACGCKGLRSHAKGRLRATGLSWTPLRAAGELSPADQRPWSLQPD